MLSTWELLRLSFSVPASGPTLEWWVSVLALTQWKGYWVSGWQVKGRRHKEMFYWYHIRAAACWPCYPPWERRGEVHLALAAGAWRGRVWNWEGGGRRVSRSGDISLSTGWGTLGGGGNPCSVTTELRELLKRFISDMEQADPGTDLCRERGKVELIVWGLVEGNIDCISYSHPNKKRLWLVS